MNAAPKFTPPVPLDLGAEGSLKPAIPPRRTQESARSSSSGGDRAAGLRRQLLDEARAAGRMGARRPNDSYIALHPEPSDTLIQQILCAFEEGQKERP